MVGTTGQAHKMKSPFPYSAPTKNSTQKKAKFKKRHLFQNRLNPIFQGVKCLNLIFGQIPIING